jgi:excisionase family DNA binding protein
MAEGLLTVEEVAGYLKIDRITLYRMLARKKILAIRVGGQWRFYRKMIDAWLMKNSNIPKERSH